MFPAIVDVLNPNFVVRSVNDAIFQDKMHIVRGFLVAGPAPKVPKQLEPAKESELQMLLRLEREGKLTDAEYGTVPPTESGVYALNSSCGNPSPGNAYGIRLAIFAHFNAEKGRWGIQQTSIESALRFKDEINFELSYPKKRIGSHFLWRGFKQPQN